jgi:hypothetical protein
MSLNSPLKSLKIALIAQSAGAHTQLAHCAHEPRYSVYLLYWYKSANADAAHPHLGKAAGRAFVTFFICDNVSSASDMSRALDYLSLLALLVQTFRTTADAAHPHLGERKQRQQ